MGNKADYIDLINAKLPNSSGGSKIPSSDHRETMHTDDNSIIELVYGDAMFDKEDTETYTTQNTLFTYKVNFTKIGGTIVLNGSFKANLNLSKGSSIFTISDSDLFSLENVTFYGTGSKNYEVMPVYIIDNHLKIGANVILDEEFYFNINYKSLN